MTAISDLLGRPVAPLEAAVNNFRLTLESGEPVSLTNQTAKTTLYLTPYVGNRIGLYYQSAWNIFASAEVSVAVPSNADTNSDVFAYWNGTAVVLEFVTWMNDAVRATDIVRQDGVWVKSGDATRRYIGTIRTTSSSGQCEDSFTKRFVWNLQNRVRRHCFTTNTTGSWSYSTAAYREYNNGTGQLRFEFVCGLPSVVDARNYGRITTTGRGYIQPFLDSTTDAGQQFHYMEVDGGNIKNGVTPYWTNRDVAIGYHYVTQVEYASSLFTNWGSGSATLCAYGAQVKWES